MPTGSTLAELFAIHSGEILLTKFIQPLELTSYRLAKEIGVANQRFGARLASDLPSYGASPAQFWLNLQNDYDLRLANKNALDSITSYMMA